MVMIYWLVLGILMALWNTPNEGIVHNLFRISFLSFLVIGSSWVIMSTYQETIKNN